MTVTPAQSVFAPFAISETGNVASLLSTTLAQQQLGGLLGGSTTVDLSGIGQLLSATDIFRNTLANLHPGSSASGLGQNFGTDFASLVAEAQYFVDAFNNLQSNLAFMQGSLGTLSGDTLAVQFARTLNTQSTLPLTNDTDDISGTSAPTSLAEIGIEFQPTPTTAVAGTLSIDLQTLQSAFESNPTGTFSLLTQAVQSFGDLAATFSARAGSEAVTFASLATFGFGQSGLFDLLLMSSFNSGNATTLTQQLMALNEFNLVSTLLG
jgi:hypothetical protein